jgi:hypothetical protein
MASGASPTSMPSGALLAQVLDLAGMNTPGCHSGGGVV